MSVHRTVEAYKEWIDRLITQSDDFENELHEEKRKVAEQDKTIRDLEDELQEQRGVEAMRLEEAGVAIERRDRTVAEQAATIEKLTKEKKGWGL
jgi:uncharacterized coiled-coil protein SlyX